MNLRRFAVLLLLTTSGVRAENYDWPRQGGSPAGELMEQVSFTNLRWNLGLTDKEFNK